MSAGYTIFSSWLASIFGAKEVHFSSIGGQPYVESGETGRVEVDINSLGNDDCYTEGLIFSSIHLTTNSGTRVLKWLPKKAAKESYLYLRGFWYRMIAPEVSRSAKEVRLVLGLGYLRDSRLHRIQAIAQQQVARFQELPPTSAVNQQSMEDFELLLDVVAWKEGSVEQLRDGYVHCKTSEFADYFDSIESHPLTVSQRQACVVDQDNNLVLAGAGTGKTSTMVGRAGFLVKSNQAQPNQILMLAFANKSALEMQERLDARVGERGVTASTFHKLGKNIIAAVEGAQPSVSPLAEDDRLLATYVNQWFEEQMQNRVYHDKVLAYFEHYLYPNANPFDFKTEGEYFNYILANDIRTLKGEAVKGLGECLLANHLFKLGVEYKYEAHYEHSTRSLDFRQYQPDFYLPEHGIYIEHVGVDRSGNTAPYVDREAYHRGMEWKRSLHKEYETQLLETYHYEYAAGRLTKLLETKLERAGVNFNPLPPEAVLETLREFGAVSSFAALLAQLLRRYKACHFEEEQAADLVRKAEDPEQVAAALDLLSPIVECYEAKLASDEQIDFDDMIGRAITYVSEGRFRSAWRYILVDEFQDISEPRARLVKALRDSVPDCSLFCVGDDWQAIYRFTGSDIGYTTEFQDKFGATKVTALDKTFRFNNSICDVASKFVLKNPAQVRKALTTHLKVNRPAVSIMRMSPERPGEDSSADPRLLEVLNKISARAEEGSTVYLLGRFGFNLPNTSTLKYLNRIYPNLAISTMTMHGSKGKEADFVVLLGLQSGKNGFPSEKTTHPLLEALLPKQESYDNAEERRLFYVAVTRARHRAYLICDMTIASEFVIELVTKQYPVELEEFETSLAQKLFQAINCKKCDTGTMVPRDGKFGSFFGCTHYPLCNNAENGCQSCGNPMQHLGRFKVCINPDCGSWVPTCPQCGAEMTQREGRNGKFWGCRNYRGEERVSCSHTENSIAYVTKP